MLKLSRVASGQLPCLPHHQAATPHHMMNLTDERISMPNIIPFHFNDKPLTAIKDEDGAPWFVATEVCNHLSLTNPSKACEGLDADEKRAITLSDIAGRPQEMLIVSEPGFYKLTMRSRKREAKAFQRWVTHEVLP